MLLLQVAPQSGRVHLPCRSNRGEETTAKPEVPSQSVHSKRWEKEGWRWNSRIIKPPHSMAYCCSSVNSWKAICYSYTWPSWSLCPASEDFYGSDTSLCNHWPFALEPTPSFYAIHFINCIVSQVPLFVLSRLYTLFSLGLWHWKRFWLVCTNRRMYR